MDRMNRVQDFLGTIVASYSLCFWYWFPLSRGHLPVGRMSRGWYFLSLVVMCDPICGNMLLLVLGFISSCVTDVILPF